MLKLGVVDVPAHVATESSLDTDQQDYPTIGEPITITTKIVILLLKLSVQHSIE